MWEEWEASMIGVHYNSQIIKYYDGENYTHTFKHTYTHLNTHLKKHTHKVVIQVLCLELNTPG